MRSTCAILATSLALHLPLTASAKDISLSFRFVTHDTSVASQIIEPVEDLTFDAATSFGVAIFDDGRLAAKKYVWINSSSDWVSHGRSAYIFENGDTIVARFISQPVGEGFAGEYEVMSGTGAYEGATGTGKFEMQDVSWESEGLWSGKFDLKLP